MITKTREAEDRRIIQERALGNLPIDMLAARWDGHRSLRLVRPGLDIGLATTAYSYALTDEEKQQAARRLAALWSLAAALEWSTEDIERFAVSASRDDSAFIEKAKS